MSIISVFIIILSFSIISNILARQFYSAYLTNRFDKIRTRKTDIKINIVKLSYTDHQKILSTGIIVGFISLIIFYFFYPFETAIANMVYLLWCYPSFYKIYKYEVLK